MDIKPPPKRKVSHQRHSQPSLQPLVPAPSAQKSPQANFLRLKNKRKSSLKWWLFGLLTIILASIIAGYTVYQQALQPKNAENKQKMRVVIKQGENSASIGDMLESREIIKSSVAFRIHAQLTGVKHQLQAGTYAFSQADSVSEITRNLKNGKTDVFNVTILPGESVKEIKKSLKKQGFTQQEVTEAFEKSYQNPLLGDKTIPASALEGYIFPETYQLDGNSDMESLLVRSMDELNERIKETDITEKLKKQNLTLEQGITLASIIQKEVVSEQDEKQVAQIFLKRLRDGMKLDADSTFVFAARQQGKTPNVEFDSSYNTRLHKGLPPGPIGNFNLAALEAVANPANGDYLYFVSGDDGTTYYAKTLKEHEKNIRQHCKANCNLF